MENQADDQIHFLDPADAYEGIVALQGDLSVNNLLRAYRRGIFPWPFDEDIIPWFCPERRGILSFAELHIPRRLERIRRQQEFRFTIDQAFDQVIEACATVERKHEAGTWITQRMIAAYCDLHRAGHAHSVETWSGDSLVGGLYGVDAGGAFAGESMFSYQSNASKLALLFLIDHLKERGLDWMDIQVMTPHMAALGAKEIERSDFLRKLSTALNQKRKLFGAVS